MTVFSPEKEKPEDLLACAKPLNDPFASWNSLLGYIPEDSEDEDVDLGEEFSAKPMATSAAKRIKIGLKDSVATNQVSSLNLPKKYFFSNSGHLIYKVTKQVFLSIQEVFLTVLTYFRFLTLNEFFALQGKRKRQKKSETDDDPNKPVS